MPCAIYDAIPSDLMPCTIRCEGLTAQNYAELATLYGKYSSQGLEILGFPCNQFGSQARNGPTSPDAHMHVHTIIHIHLVAST